MNFGYHSFGIDPKRVAPFLPPGIVLTSEHIGFTALCTITDAWSLGSFSWAFGGVVIEHHESPDGSEGALVLFSYASPNAHSIFAELYEVGSTGGETRVWDEEGLWWSTTGPAAGPPHLRIGVRPSSEVMVIDGIDLYLSCNAGGHLVEWTAAYVGDCRVGEIEVFEIAPDAPPALQAIAPTNTHWGARNTDFRASFSAPQLTRHLAGDNAGWAAERAFLTLLGTHPSAALVLGADLRVRHMNGAARALVGAHVSGTQGYLRSSDVVAQYRLEATIANTLAGMGEKQPFRLMFSDREPLIAQAFPLDSQVFGPGAVLLFVTNPRAPATLDVVPSLRLLGLTEAEARIAGLVGGGSSPRVSAGQLGITEHTVRSTLKRIYDKLDIRRQAELATLVSRLAGG